MFLVLFFLSALFRALQGLPISSLDPLGEADCDLFPRDTAPRDTLANLALCVDNRTEWGIIRSCLFTIFACTWTAIHPNIGAPTDSQWIIFRRRLSVMLCALIAPEVMVLWAMKQRQGAKHIIKKYNKEIVDADTPETSIFISLKDLFETPLREAEGGLLPWSMAHGFFLEMGGLLLYKDGQPEQVLDYTRLKRLIRDKKIDIPLLSKAEIQDRGKGDIIVKGLVVVQTLGFVVQSIARLLEGLPLIELEVITLAFAMLNGITYFLWWDKPQNVGVAIRVPLKGSEGKKSDSQSKPQQQNRVKKFIEDEVPLTEKDFGSEQKFKRSNFTDSVYASPASLMSEETLLGAFSPRKEDSQDNSQESLQDSFIDQKPSDFSCSTGDQQPSGWWRQKISKDFKYPGIRDWKNFLCFFFLRMPYQAGELVCYPFSKMGGGAKLGDGKHRVPMFYAESGVDDVILALSTIIATAFGLIHFLAWSVPFPSDIEKVLWRSTTLIITVEPVFFMIANPSWEPEVFKRWPWVASFITGLARFGMPLYVVARLVLLVLAFSSLRDLPRAAYQTVEWTGVIPHL